jgi:hypothetical protein
MRGLQNILATQAQIDPFIGLTTEIPWGGFAAELRWAIYTRKDARVMTKRELFEGSPQIRRAPDHALSDLDNRRLPQPEFRHQGDIDFQLDDYLLITVLPRDSRLDRRIISLAGLHKAGTLAAEALLSDGKLAQSILKKVHTKVEGLPYYQALIHLKVDHSTGTPAPTCLELVDAEPIKNVSRLKL